mmetsp:Transcript_8673/g.17172  ORF Transcript_8673/g.17172 Transcript_8673/m.17172 type:complete len:201 (+) Transcript_8673:1988-2590(+)
MDLVDKENDLAIGILNFLENRLQALLELTTVRCTGKQSGHVELPKSAVGNGFRHVALDDTHSKHGTDGRLTHTGRAHKDGIGLCLTRKNLDNTSHFAIAANNWVKLAVHGSLGEVSAILGECLEVLLATSSMNLTSTSTTCSLCGFFDFGRSQVNSFKSALKARIVREGLEQAVKRKEGISLLLLKISSSTKHAKHRARG